MIAHVLLSEVGRDLSKFRSAAAFASWLGLCPDNRVGGGKVLSSRTRQLNHRLARALRMAARALFRSRSWLGQYFRRMQAKLGALKAITAAAHKLAPSSSTDHLRPTGGPNIQRIQQRLRQRAKQYGFQLLEIAAQ